MQHEIGRRILLRLVPTRRLEHHRRLATLHGRTDRRRRVGRLHHRHHRAVQPDEFGVGVFGAVFAFHQNSILVFIRYVPHVQLLDRRS